MEKNPFAELADNESLYIDDPKKMIEKWFDREGYDFDKSHYQVNLFILCGNNFPLHLKRRGGCVDQPVIQSNSNFHQTTFSLVDKININ